MRDITDRRLAQEALQRAHDGLEHRVKERTSELSEANLALERSNRELQDFAYVASHDLQEPLRKITNFCQLLRQDYGGQLDEMADTYIDYAVDGALRMQQLINDLLELSRVSLSDVVREWVEMRAAVDQALQILEVPIKETGASIEIGDLPSIFAEPSGLVRVYQNLIGNAIKFRRGTPHVEISAERTADEWLFSIRDDGIGIDPTQRDRLFVMFRRLHGSEQYPGTGIGLAIARSVVEAHGGRIRAESEPGKGSVFTFELPVAPATETRRQS